MDAHSTPRHTASMHGMDQYKAISREYKASKLLPVREMIEKPVLLWLLRDTLPGARSLLGLPATSEVEARAEASTPSHTSKRPAILDLACGDGHYSRLWAALGATRVLGVDLCPEMVALGQAQGLGLATGVGVTTSTAGSRVAAHAVGTQAEGASTAESDGHNNSPTPGGSPPPTVSQASAVDLGPGPGPGPGPACHLSYVVGDALDASTFTTPAGIEQHTFDVITGVYVLNYAQSEGQLEAMVRTAACMLKPGGLFVGMNNNPFSDGHSSLLDPSAAARSCARYGLCRTRQQVVHAWSGCNTAAGGQSAQGRMANVPPLQSGEPIHLIFMDTRAPGAPSPKDFPLNATAGKQWPTFRFDNFHLPPQLHEEVFRRAGFTDFRWVPCSTALPYLTSPARADCPQADPGLWTDFCAEDSCPLIGFTARYEGERT